MPDIDSHADWWDKMRTLRNHLAHIPYAARHQVSVAQPLFEEIDAACQTEELPADLKARWAQYGDMLIQAGQAAKAFADKWDADFPVLEARPE